MSFNWWFGREFDVWLNSLSFGMLNGWIIEVLIGQILIYTCLMLEIGLNMIYACFRTCRNKFEWNWKYISWISKFCIILQKNCISVWFNRLQGHFNRLHSVKMYYLYIFDWCNRLKVVLIDYSRGKFYCFAKKLISRVLDIILTIPTVKT